MSDKKLMLIDGNSLLYRAFYALPLLHNREGIYTNGVYGFLTMYNRIVEQEKPTHIVVAFDMDKKTFRTERFVDYKANRSAPPDELTPQFQLLRDVLKALKVKYIEVPGFEADDIIGTISKIAETQGVSSIIVTGDGDNLQLVSDSVKVLMTKKGITDIQLYDINKVIEKWEVPPEKMIEIKALMGDSSDNIPGVPGVGAKTAIKLIKQFNKLENIYENLDQVSGKKLKERLAENRDKAFLSRELAEIVRDMDLDIEIDEFQKSEPDYENLIQIYKRLEFNNFLATLNKKAGSTAKELEKIDVIELECEEDVEKLIKQISKDDLLSLYFKTDYHHPMWCNLKSIYIEFRKQVYSLNIGEKINYKISWLKPFFEAKDIKKLIHNQKFVQVLLSRYGIQLRGIECDTMLLTYINDSQIQNESLSNVILQYLNVTVTEDNPECLVIKIQDLYQVLIKDLPQDLKYLLYNVEIPLSNTLGKMEIAGIKVNKKILETISEEFSIRLSKDEERIYELAGGSFNINSPKQLGKVLFEDLGLRVVKKTKTGYSTGAEVLEELYDEHEIIPYILDYRHVSKLKSTYVDALQELIHVDTGRVHTIFKQALTTTGRLSSVEPNLQNIPIKMEEGRRIRNAFTAKDDWYLISADYSQIDLRALAHISEDATLIETFKKGIDIHTRTASEIFNVDISDVNSDLRRRAKAVNFGIVYGISDFGLSRDTGVSRKEAKRYIEEYLDSYPGVRQYMDNIVEFGKKHGYVETVLKRRRYLPDLNAKNKMVQSFAKRMALNTPIQGSSADIIKLAMLKINDEIETRKLKSQLLIQVHDDLLLEVPKEEIEETTAIVKEAMENAYSLKVPLEVSLNIGRNWYEMEEWK